MTADQFVATAREIAERGAVRGVLDVLRRPPGRKPPRTLVELSDWFNGLSDDQGEKVERAIALGAQQALYNLLLVLDGTLPVSSDQRVQRFELYAEDEVGRTLINDNSAIELSAIFKSLD